MKTATANMIQLLADAANGVPIFVAERTTCTLANGNTVEFSTRRSASDPTAPMIKRGSITTKVGLQAAYLSLTLLIDTESTIDGADAYQFAQAGGLDGANIVTRRDYWYLSSPSGPAVGNLHLFQGSMSQIDELSDTRIAFSVVSDAELLNQMMPKRMYQTTCQHSIYDAGCTLDPADFEVAVTVGANATIYSIPTDLVANAGTFNLGTITFTSGALQGTIRTIKSQANDGTIVPVLPLPFAPAPGDGAVTLPNCQNVYETCNGPLFNNGENFLGFEFIPVPEASY